LFTGVAILGAIGSGKTSCCMYPFAEQILAYRSGDTERRIGGLVLKVKGDFCHRVKEILARHGRAEDYIEISLDSQYRYNPLQSDLDAYALAYNIASLLNNLFGRGKEPFWQPTKSLSQSEHDWAYAKRALARGDDPKKSFAALPTIAPKKSTQTTPVTPSKKRELLSTRSGEMFNLSQKPQVIPLRSASEAKG
jgi:hypothetical protein